MIRMTDLLGGGVAATAVEKGVVQVLGFVQSIILARLLCPSDFGLAAMLSVFLCVGNLLAESGLGTAYVVYGGRGRAVVRWNVAIALAFYAVLALSAPCIATFYGQPVLRPLLLVMGLGIVMDAASVLGQARLQRARRFTAISVVNCMATFGGLLAGVVLAVAGYGVWAIAGVGVAAGGLRFFLLFFLAGDTDDDELSPPFAVLLRYGLKLTLSGFIGVVYANLFQLAIGKMFSPTAAGLYTRGNRWARLPADVVNEPAARLSLPAFTRSVCSVRTALLANAALVWSGAAVLAVFAPQIIRFVLGEAWLPCVPYLRILLVGAAFTPVSNIAQTLIKASGEAETILRADAVKKPVAFALLGACAFGRTSIAGFCWAKSVADIVDAFVDAWAALRVYFRRRNEKAVVARETEESAADDARAGIAVLMACHNRRDLTLRCLRGLLPQLAATDRVFLVDDGSTDGTSDAVSSAFGDSVVRLIPGDGSLYWAKAMRKAWDAALAESGSWRGFLWVNDDCELSADAVGKALATSDGAGVSVGEFVSPTTGSVTYGLRENLFTGNFVYVPWAAYEKVGPICGKYSHAWADSDYALRCRRADVEFASCGVVGRCEGHPNRPSLSGLPLASRWRLLSDPKGWCLRDLWIYRRRNWGVAAAVFSCVHLFLHVLKGED